MQKKYQEVLKMVGLFVAGALVAVIVMTAVSGSNLKGSFSGVLSRPTATINVKPNVKPVLAPSCSNYQVMPIIAVTPGFVVGIPAVPSVNQTVGSFDIKADGNKNLLVTSLTFQAKGNIGGTSFFRALGKISF